MITSSFFLLPQASAQAPEDPNIIALDSEYSNSDLNFKIQYPSRFARLHDNPSTGPVVWFRYEIPPNPQYPVDSSSHTLRIPLQVYEREGHTFETIREYLLTTWLFDNFKATKDMLVGLKEGLYNNTIQGNQAYALEYSVRQAGVGDEYTVQNIITIVGDKIYILSYIVSQINHTVTTGLTPDNFRRYYTIFAKMWNSFCFPINSGATAQCPVGSSGGGGGGGGGGPPGPNATTTVTEEWVNPNYRDRSINYGEIYRVVITCKTSSSEYRDFCAKDAGKIEHVRIFAGGRCISNIQECDLGMTENIVRPNQVMCATLPSQYCPFIWEAKAMNSEGSIELWKLQAFPVISSKVKVSFNHQYRAEITFSGIYDLVYDKTTICDGTICTQQTPLTTTTTTTTTTTPTTGVPSVCLPIVQDIERLKDPVDLIIEYNSQIEQKENELRQCIEENSTAGTNTTPGSNTTNTTSTVPANVTEEQPQQPQQPQPQQCPSGMQLDEFNRCRPIEGQEEAQQQQQTQQPLPPFEEETFPEGTQPPGDDDDDDGSGDSSSSDGDGSGTGDVVGNTTTTTTTTTTTMDPNAVVDQDQDLDGFTLATGDCDDTNPSAFPAATEVAANGIDDDCDEIVDEEP